MSAWTIYWVMQLNTISNFLFIFTLISLIFSFLSALQYSSLISTISHFSVETRELYYRDFDASKRVFTISKRFFIASIFGSIAFSIIPSTRTVAAMLVLPDIVNNDHVKQEHADLYVFAKQALEDLAKRD